MIYQNHCRVAERSLFLNCRSAYMGGILALLSFGAAAQDVPPPAFDPSMPATPTIQPPNPCDTQPCFKAAPNLSGQSQPYVTTTTPPPGSDSPATPSMDDTMSSIENGKITYEVAAPLSNAAASSLPKTNPLKIVDLPEIPKAAGYVFSAAQVGVKCYNGAQKDGAEGCIAEGGKEAVLATAQTVGTEVGTCLAAETGPFAPVIGAAAGLCARAVTEMAIDNPAVVEQMSHAFDCDPYGNCIDRSLTDSADSARNDMESQYDQTSATNDAAAAQAQQQAAAQAAPSTDGDANGGNFFAALAQGLTLATRLQLPPQGPTAPANIPGPAASSSVPTVPTPSIPAGWVPCDCPAQHASFGQYFGGTLYHPVGPKCH